MMNSWNLPDKEINGIHAVKIHDKWYPYSLIYYLTAKPNNNRDPSTYTTKYIDDMKDTIKNNFDGFIQRGFVTSFYQNILPVYRDIAKSKGYIIINIRGTDSGWVGDIVKMNYRKHTNKSSKNISRKHKIKKCKCK